MNEPLWYVVHTYSGYENKVKANLEKIIENRNLQEQILEVSVPMHDVLETKNGTTKKHSRKVFPGYVLIKMIMTDETWYLIRNTRGVTSFVGPGSKPVPLTEEEIAFMGIDLDEFIIDINVGDSVRVINGAFADTIAEVREIHKKTLVACFTMFGRETMVTLDVDDVQKL